MATVVEQSTVAVAQKLVKVYPDPTYVTFVAKAQKAKTRKGLDYFVIRVTIPKEVAAKADVRPDDYILLKAKKAQWFHIMEWNQESAWKMLPQAIKTEIYMSGLPNPDSRSLGAPTGLEAQWQFGSAAAGMQGAPVPLAAYSGEIGVER